MRSLTGASEFLERSARRCRSGRYRSGHQGTIMLSSSSSSWRSRSASRAPCTSRSTPASPRFARWTRVNVRNLAGVPSIVYGLLGLAIFVKALNGLGDPAENLQRNGFFPSATSATSSTGSVATTAATSSPAAWRSPHSCCRSWSSRRPKHCGPCRARSARARSGSAPRSGRRCAITCCRRPRPGILTGTMLSLARAAGEAAPILLVGADRPGCSDHRRAELPGTVATAVHGTARR